jgi:Alpha-galactosidases/6-phospho-beta-glucosidases, family 4 of glycosyl hydrolases
MNKKLKIAVIGGGSSYTPEIIEGFIYRKAELPIKEIWLADIEAEKVKLQITGILIEHVVKEAGLDWNIHVMLNREEALKNADFVLLQETNAEEERFNAYHTIPVVLNIVENMKRLCPDAWLVNINNSCGMVTEAIMRYGKWNKVVGLCNLPIMCQKIAAAALDEEVEDLYFRFGGLNHFHWHRVWDRLGREKTKEVIENIPFLTEQIHDLEIIPCMYLNSEQPQKPSGAFYSDVVCEFISSIYNDKCSPMVVNTMNHRAIKDLPEDVVVEVSCIITSSGPVPISWGSFDPSKKKLLQQMKDMELRKIKEAIIEDFQTAL